MLHHYKAVFLDAGDTLITIPKVHHITVRFLEQYGMKVEEQQMKHALQQALNTHYYQREKDVHAICSPDEDRRFWVMLYKEVLSTLGVIHQYDPDKMNQICHAMYDMFLLPEHYHVFEDVAPSMQKMREMGLQVGIISNFADSLHHILADKGIVDLFDTVIVSAEVGVEKPNPKIFEIALEHTGLSPHEMLYIGDHDINDVWAPKQLGIDAIKITRYPHQTGEGITSLKELFK
ncbi:HAD-IA family hydrolase [Longirhabdus pacifica]|uniref:HAD-IA family hydrolase n=1 Tax=Longirhabdus pacifica TaxID=2305227 RepID=UPI0010089B7D|nr:HAD-IA family hydrolase [Longirhabdus pacifica]